MTASPTPQEKWNRLRSDLRAYNSAESAIWGNIDDNLVARYIADECNSDEKQQVEQAARAFPAIQEAINVVRSVMGAPAKTTPHSDSPSKQLYSNTEFSAVNITKERAGTIALDDRSQWAIPKPRPRQAVLTVICLLCAVVALVEYRMIQSQRDEIKRLLVMQGNKSDLKSGVPAHSKVLSPTSSHENWTVDWPKIVNAFYDEKLSAAENLDSLEKHGGEPIRSKIRELRQAKPSMAPSDIIQELFRVFGKPDDSQTSTP